MIKINRQDFFLLDSEMKVYMVDNRVWQARRIIKKECPIDTSVVYKVDNALGKK
jgi:hypothetical protein